MSDADDLTRREVAAGEAAVDSRARREVDPPPAAWAEERGVVEEAFPGLDVGPAWSLQVVEHKEAGEDRPDHEGHAGAGIRAARQRRLRRSPRQSSRIAAATGNVGRRQPCVGRIGPMSHPALFVPPRVRVSVLLRLPLVALPCLPGRPRAGFPVRPRAPRRLEQRSTVGTTCRARGSPEATAARARSLIPVDGALPGPSEVDAGGADHSPPRPGGVAATAFRRASVDPCRRAPRSRATLARVSPFDARPGRATVCRVAEGTPRTAAKPGLGPGLDALLEAAPCSRALRRRAGSGCEW